MDYVNAKITWMDSSKETIQAAQVCFAPNTCILTSLGGTPIYIPLVNVKKVELKEPAAVM